MAEDPAEPVRRGGALGELTREDLEVLGLSELEERVETLRVEITRCQAQIERKRAGRNAADSLFKF